MIDLAQLHTRARPSRSRCGPEGRSVLRSRLLSGLAAGLAGVLAGGGGWTAFGVVEAPDLPEPQLDPDYVGVVIPPNLAPLNCRILEPGIAWRVSLTGPRGEPVHLESSDGQVRWPLPAWRALLSANRGQWLRWDVAVRGAEGAWKAHRPVTNRVAAEPIDSHLVYRRLRPLFSYYRTLGIYERDLESFAERPLLRNEAIDHGCLNCHAFCAGAPDRFALALRLPEGTPTLLGLSNRVWRIAPRMGYPAWHPGGQLLVFSTNAITQFFHWAGPVNRDIYDARSDLVVYRVNTGQLVRPAALARPDQNENWPAWSPDGRYLYYCSGRTMPFRYQQRFRYDLYRIAYDPEASRWGDPELLFAADEHRLSAQQPRVAPDGEHVVFSAIESGCFPVFQPASDLYLLSLPNRQVRPLEVNSPQADSWHCWSGNGRWLVYSSKRRDGVFSLVYLSYFDASGQFSKPLLLPQEDPAYHDTCLDNFNVPELRPGPVPYDEAALVRALSDPASRLTGSSEVRPTVSDRRREERMNEEGDYKVE